MVIWRKLYYFPYTVCNYLPDDIMMTETYIHEGAAIKVYDCTLMAIVWNILYEVHRNNESVSDD